MRMPAPNGRSHSMRGWNLDPVLSLGVYGNGPSEISALLGVAFSIAGLSFLFQVLNLQQSIAPLSFSSS